MSSRDFAGVSICLLIIAGLSFVGIAGAEKEIRELKANDEGLRECIGHAQSEIVHVRATTKAERWENTKMIVALQAQVATLYERAERSKRYMTISGKDENGDLRMSNGKRLIYMELNRKDGKKHVVLPKWYTDGKEATMLRSDKIKAAWDDRMPGVWRMDYDSPVIKESFKDCVIEVD